MNNPILKTVRNFLLLVIPLFMVSCFSITEEYSFNNDGSGKASYKIDLTEIMSMWKMMASSDSTGSTLKSIDSTFNNKELLEELKLIPGITNVENKSDTATGIVLYTYNFSNLVALNKAIKLNKGSASLGLETGTAENKNEFIAGKKMLQRYYSMANISNEEDENTAMVEMMYKDATYTTIYHFEKSIKKVNNSDATISKDRKSVVLEAPLLDLFNGKKNLNCTVKTK